MAKIFKIWDTVTGRESSVSADGSTIEISGSTLQVKSGVFAAAGHNHDSAYLGITAKASDSDKLDGLDSTDFASSGHDHDADYLGITAKAADADKLDGLDSTDFASSGHDHDADYLGITAKASDSDKLDGLDSTDFASSGHDHDADYLGITAKAADSDKLDGLDSTAFILASEKGATAGVATLDSNGKVPVGQLPNSVMEYQGAWDADTNTPELADGVGNAGDVYRVSVEGTQNLGSGNITFYVGDFVIYSGSIWQRSPLADGVISVDGQVGAVSLTASYLGITAKASDSDKLDGLDSTDFASSGHDHDADYLGITAKASDSDKLDGLDSTDFASSGHDHDSDYLGITAKAADSDMLNGQTAAFYSEATHNHNAAYLGITAKASDSDKLDGLDSTDFASSGHDHDADYLGITAKASDSDKLDGLDSTDFASSGHDHDADYLGITAKASDSDMLNGQTAGYYAAASSLSGYQAIQEKTLENNQGDAITIRQICYIKSNGKVGLAKADSNTTSDAAVIVKDASIADAASGKFYTPGQIIGSFSSLTPGKMQYVSAATAGAMTETAPSTSGQVIFELGRAISASEIVFVPRHIIDIA